MGEEKIRLEQLRGTIHIDIPGTAAAAGVPARIVYFMLIGKPVFKTQAEKVLKVLSMPDKPLTLENVDIVLWDDALILHCIRATDGIHFEYDQFYCVYARDEQQARTLASTWIAHVSISFPEIYFTQIPEGLVIGDMHVPGWRGKLPEKQS